MIKRFVIAAIIVGLFLGGVGYFNLVFKPKMIDDFVAKMVPPAATVTAEAAKTESWIDRLRRHRHADGHRGRRRGAASRRHRSTTITSTAARTSRRARSSSSSTPRSRKPTSPTTRPRCNQTNPRSRAAIEAGQDGSRVAGHPRQTIAKRDSAAASVQHVEALIAQKNITAPFAGRLGLRHVEKGQYVSAGQALVWLQSLDPIWIDFPVPEGKRRQVQDRQRDRAHRRRLSGPDVQRRGRGLRRASSAQDTRTLMVRAHGAQCGPQAAARHVRQCRACSRAARRSSSRCRARR